MFLEEMTRKVALFLILFLSSSYTICNDLWPSFVTIALWIFVTMILLVRNSKICIGQFVAGSILIVFLGLSTFINSENERTFFLLAYSYIVLILYSSQVEFAEFVDDYQSLLRFLCKVSIACYIGFLLIPQLHDMLSFVNNAGEKATNLIIYVEAKHSSRNMGMFWEPGAFQTFINLALLFEMSKKKIDKKNVILYILTVLTTYSTTGYLAMALILFLPFFKKKVSIKKKFSLLVVMLLIVGVCFFLPTINKLLFASSISGQSTVFGKIINFLNRTSSSNVLTSADIRYNAIFEVWRAFLERPLCGYGYQGLADRTYMYTHGMNTCTFLNWFATYGVFYGITAMVGVICFAASLTNDGSSIVLNTIILFVITMSENYIQHASILLILFYGFYPFVMNRRSKTGCEINESS